MAVHVCLGLIVEYWSFVGMCGCHSYSKLAIVMSSCFFCKPLQPAIPPYMPLVYIPIYMLAQYYEKNKKLVKISHYLLARLVVQKLIDN